MTTLVSISRTLPCNQIADALISKYGAGVTIHFVDGNNVVFSCPAICDKVIKLTYQYYVYGASDVSDKMFGYYGDSWTSGTNIVNSVQFAGNSYFGNNLNSTVLWAYLDLILADNYIMFSGSDAYKELLIIGKLTNGRFLCIGFGSPIGLDYTYVKSIGRLTDSGVSVVTPIGMDCAFSSDGKLVLFPSYFMEGNNILINSDGSPAYISGLFVGSVVSRMVSSEFYASPIGYYNSNSIYLVRNSYVATLI